MEKRGEKLGPWKDRNKAMRKLQLRNCRYDFNGFEQRIKYFDWRKIYFCINCGWVISILSNSSIRKLFNQTLQPDVHHFYRAHLNVTSVSASRVCRKKMFAFHRFKLKRFP